MVILAIIALIATPIVLNIIDDSRKAATLESAKNYIHAVELSIANCSTSAGNTIPQDEYNSSNKGRILTGKNTEMVLNVDFDGQAPSKASILIENGKIYSASVIIGKYTSNFSGNDWDILESSNSETSKTLYESLLANDIEPGDSINYISPYNSSITWKVLGKTPEGNIKILSDEVVEAPLIGVPEPDHLESCSTIDFTNRPSDIVCHSISRRKYIYLNTVSSFNNDSLLYSTGINAVGAHGLNLDEVAELCGVTLVKNNSEQEITGVFPDSNVVETRTITDNYNKFEISSKVDTQSKIYNMLIYTNRSNYSLASTSINIYNNVAYFNIDAVYLGGWVQGMEQWSAGISERGPVSVLSADYWNYNLYRPVVIIDGTANVTKDSSGIWNFE